MGGFELIRIGAENWPRFRDRVVQLEQSFPDPLGASPEKFDADMVSPDNIAYVAVLPDAPEFAVAYGLAEPIWRVRSLPGCDTDLVRPDKTLYLSSCVVDPAVRGHGLSKELRHQRVREGYARNFSRFTMHIRTGARTPGHDIRVLNTYPDWRGAGSWDYVELA